MSLALRKIERGRWLTPSSMGANETPASALLDLQTTGNKLSIWVIKDNGENLTRVTAALAAQRAQLSKLDYATVPLEDLRNAGFGLEESPGDSLDAEANKSHMHLVELTVSKIAQLSTVLRPPERRTRIPERIVGRLIDEAIASGHLDATILPQTLSEDLDKNRHKWASSG